MSTNEQPRDKVNKKISKKKKEYGLFSSSLISRKITIPYKNLGGNIKEVLQKKLENQLEGRCNIEGFIKSSSINILTYSSGVLQGNNIVFDVAFECEICCPVEGMLIKCNVKNITQAGIRAFSIEEPSPIVAYLSRDHHYSKVFFNELKENDEILVRVIGKKFELNDSQISLIGELVEQKQKKPRKITIKN
tara:strand:+ start:1063 stop:1635 length:573 start_codon:yes stop_codon:yes gene_type:complete